MIEFPGHAEAQETRTCPWPLLVVLNLGTLADEYQWLEERRLALDELKAQQEHELASRELDLKSKETGWISRLFTPLTTTVFAGILTFAASAVGTQSHNALDLERQKFEANMQLEQRKEQHELILKIVSVGDEKRVS